MILKKPCYQAVQSPLTSVAERGRCVRSFFSIHYWKEQRYIEIMNEHNILKSPVEGVNMQAQRAQDTLLRCRLSSFLMNSLGLFYVMIFIIRIHTTVH